MKDIVKKIFGSIGAIVADLFSKPETSIKKSAFNYKGTQLNIEGNQAFATNNITQATEEDPNDLIFELVEKVKEYEYEVYSQQDSELLNDTRTKSLSEKNTEINKILKRDKLKISENHKKIIDNLLEAATTYSFYAKVYAIAKFNNSHTVDRNAERKEQAIRKFDLASNNFREISEHKIYRDGK